MNILVINGDCLQFNTSANLCHLAYIKGLAEAGHTVSVLSASGKDYRTDALMEIPAGVRQYTYPGMSFYEKLSQKKKGSSGAAVTVSGSESTGGKNKKTKWSHKLKSDIKKLILGCYGPHGIYATFVRKAGRFRSDEKFDMVISLSTPPSSHLLAYKLLHSGHVSADRWIQIWEDPWYSDAYGFNGKKSIFREEKRLLSYAREVCYVSPLTLKNQQKLFPEASQKMFWQPLPSYYEDCPPRDPAFGNVYGYFGDYYAVVRNLEPFYRAALETDTETNICGNSNTAFGSEKSVHVSPRLPLHELKPIENRTGVLVFLCNRKGGQIPGKIYQYSATDKPILFILDGTDEEKEIIRNYFERYHRYVFCENRTEDIIEAMKTIRNGDFGTIRNEPITDFSPKTIIAEILKGKET